MGQGAGRKTRQNGDRFTKQAAKETGASERSLQRDAERGKLAVINDVVGASLDKGTEIDALAELAKDEPQRHRIPLAADRVGRIPDVLAADMGGLMQHAITDYVPT